MPRGTVREVFDSSTVRYLAMEIDSQEAVSQFLHVHGQVSQFIDVPRQIGPDAYKAKTSFKIKVKR